jgi:hypothetical protein
VLVLYGFCILLGAAALVLTYANSVQASLLLLVLALVAFVFLRSLGYMRLSRMSMTVIDRKRYRAMRAAVRDLGKRVERIRRLDEMWPIVIETVGLFGATSARLVLEPAPGSDVPPTTFSHGPSSEPADEPSNVFRYQFVVPASKGRDRTLELGWTDGRQHVDRDTEIAVDVFCEFLATGLDAVKELQVLPPQRAAGKEPRA